GPGVPARRRHPGGNCRHRAVLRENRHEARGLASTHSAPGGPPAVPDRGQHVPQSRQLGGGAARDRLMLMRNARRASAEAVNGPLLGGQTKKSHAAADKFWIHYPRAFSRPAALPGLSV